MVDDTQHHIFGFCQLQQRDAQEREPREIERPHRLIGANSFNGCLLLHGWSVPEICF